MAVTTQFVQAMDKCCPVPAMPSAMAFPSAVKEIVQPGIHVEIIYAMRGTSVYQQGRLACLLRMHVLNTNAVSINPSSC